MKKITIISLMIMVLFIPLLNSGTVKALSTFNQPNDIVNSEYKYDYVLGDALGYRTNTSMVMQMSNYLHNVTSLMQQTHVSYDRVNFTQTTNLTGTNSLLVYKSALNNTKTPDFQNNSNWGSTTNEIKTLNGSRFIYLNQSYFFPNDIYVKDIMLQNMSFYILPSLIYGGSIWTGYVDLFQTFKTSVGSGGSISGIVDESKTTYQSDYIAYNYTGLSTDHGYFIAVNDTAHYNITVNTDSVTNITMTTFHSIQYTSSSFIINAVVSNGTHIYDINVLEAFVINVELLYESTPAPARPNEIIGVPTVNILDWFSDIGNFFVTNWLWVTLIVVVIGGSIGGFYIFRYFECKDLNVEARSGKRYCPKL